MGQFGTSIQEAMANIAHYGGKPFRDRID